jgi:hypothetical protein
LLGTENSKIGRDSVLEAIKVPVEAMNLQIQAMKVTEVLRVYQKRL